MNSPKIYGLLGWPVGHSLSPSMHNAAFKALGINAQYQLFGVKPEELDFFLSSLSAKNISGLNITVPYKEQALKFAQLDKESFFLNKIKAINTMVFEDGIWKGFNTDIPGFSRHLREGFDPVNKKAAILGAGGAARAVAYVLANAKASLLQIYDIDKAKALNIVTMVKEIFPEINIEAVNSFQELDLLNKDLLVNATPIGLKSTDPLLVEEKFLHKNLFVYDLIYNPAKTKLLEAALQKGCRVSNGLGMLLYQGMLSFSHWTKCDAPEVLMRQALLEGLKQV